MGILFGFAPWIIYWVLVGNVPFLVAVLVALTMAIATFVISRISGAPGRTLEVGALATFIVLTVLTLVLSQDVMERWMQPLSNAGIFLVALIGLLLGKPFVLEYVVHGDATILDTKTPLSFICYWVIPFTLLGLAALASRVLPDRMTAGMNDIVRKTTFVAFSEAEIDQLYYLAQEHANREVGAGQEAYDVRVGGSGTPLVGDESRMSWPSTYKVRDRKR
ncbi:hypothetical protein [Mycolicibacterium sp. CBMA 295]|uniref:hypothetical protein n=1 Tax=Mycolicibacterium sp. CBMA 295 TaxID=2606605 RepID=UPI001306AE0D|nr:hypothetical protein [Mycolicibacterium sp. CBMA 295]MUM26948.1 hypothetical protein [Mycolicibacterium sp. CBMA 295]